MAAPLPRSIRAALASLAVAIGLLAYVTAAAARAGGGPGWPQVGFAALVALLLLAGIVARRRLAWLWGHALSLFLAILQAVSLAAGIWQQKALPLPLGLVPVAIVLALLASWWSLGRPTALAWFGLLCPACGTPSRLGADLLFRRARCRACGNLW